LKEFYGERDARQKQFEDLKTKAEDDFEGKLSMEAFAEDWNASQFWVRGILLSRKTSMLTLEQPGNSSTALQMRHGL
jgi:hypothetical protein